jgi:hypothetical protein
MILLFFLNEVVRLKTAATYCRLSIEDKERDDATDVRKRRAFRKGHFV